MTADYADVLQQLTDLSARVGGLSSIVVHTRTEPGEESEYLALCHDVHVSLKLVLGAISDVQARSTKLGIGLQVHQPDLITTIRIVEYDRSQPLPVADPLEQFLRKPEQCEVVSEFVSGHHGALQDRLRRAQLNLADIRRTCGDLRKFLASQFSFREMISITQ